MLEMSYEGGFIVMVFVVGAKTHANNIQVNEYKQSKA